MLHSKNICIQVSLQGSRFYVNAQVLVTFIKSLQLYKEEKIDLQEVFAFVRKVKKQNKVALYTSLMRELDELTILEEYIQKGRITLFDRNIINYCIDSCINTFTLDKEKVYLP